MTELDKNSEIPRGVSHILEVHLIRILLKQ